MRRMTVSAVLLLVGCDRVFGLERAERPGDGAHVCALGGAFAAGTPVPIDGAYSVEGARFTPTQSVAYLSLCPASGDKMKCDLYQSSFLQGTFTSYILMAGVSDATHYDAYPTITPDGKYLLFGSRRGTPLRVYVAASNNGSFDAPTISSLAVIAGMNHSNEPYLLGDGRTLYLSGQNALSQGDDLFRASGDPPDFGGAAELVPGVATADSELAPVVTNDELEIYFASDRGVGNFALDIYTATRRSAAMPFEPAVRIPELSTDGIDWPLWISPDACDLYYINKVGVVATMYVSHR